MKKENKDLLIFLLESILGKKIKDVEYLNLERNVDNVYVKRKHFDLNLKTDIGRIQVEVNASNLDYVKPRNMAYICDTYSHYTLRGEDYMENVDIIQINFTYGMNDEEKLRVYKVQDDSKKTFVKNFLIYEFNMEKYKELWYTDDKEEIEKNKAIIMLDLGLNELKALSRTDRKVERYMEELKRVNDDPDFHEYMSAEQDNRMIENSIKREFLEKGIAEGMEKGMEMGILEGRNEILKETAKKFLEEGVEISIISNCTGLSEEEISAL